LSPTDQGTTNLQVNGEDALFVGVQMVPDITIAKPDFGAAFSIRNITLKSESDVDRWKTILPYNILNPSTIPSVRFEAIDGDLRARLKIWVDSDGSFDPVEDLYSDQIVGNSTIPINLPMAELQSATVYFEVQPIAEQLGSGEYTLEMKVRTTNSEDYLLLPSAFRFAGTSPSDAPADIVELPDVPVVDIAQNQFGNGQAEGTFTNQDPLTVGSLDIYRFWAITPGSVSVRTVGLSEDVNTNARIYKRVVASNGVEYLTLVSASDALGDWFPADRSVIDDQTYVNNFNELTYGESASTYDTGGGYYYAIAATEQGTTGDYRIEVDAENFPRIGDESSYSAARRSQVIQFPPNQSGLISTAVSLPYVEAIEDFVGVIPIQMPAYHDGTLQVEGDFAVSWNLALFDELGQRLIGTVEQGNFGRTLAQFQVPDGSRTVFLQVHELEEMFNPDANLLLYTTVNLPPGVTPPQTSVPGGNQRMLFTNPSGDTLTDFQDAFSAANQSKRYGLTLPAGQSTISVMPDRTDGQNDVEIQWAVYVDGELWAWNDTRRGDSGNELTLSLPNNRTPFDRTDFDFDANMAHDVVLYVLSQTDPTNNGGLSIRVDSKSDLPIQNGRMDFNPRGWIETIDEVMDGKSFKRINIPQGYEDMTLTVGANGTSVPSGTEIRYQLFKPNGELVASESKFTTLFDPIFDWDDS
ncbi:MAG: hypothetical protein AAF497_22260, partial [Planctomycetota bacterium]